MGYSAQVARYTLLSSKEIELTKRYKEAQQNQQPVREQKDIFRQISIVKAEQREIIAANRLDNKPSVNKTIERKTINKTIDRKG